MESLNLTKKLFIKTFGCQMNEYDSAKMADILEHFAGYTLTDTVTEADIIIFNTCSIREKAQEKVFSDLGRVRDLKKNNSQLIIAVGGCVASQEGDTIIKRAPYVDIVFGPQTLHRLPQLIKQVRQTGKAQIDISFPEIEKFDHLPRPKVAAVSAYVSIMEGCSKYCSYCVVPYTRGEEISRPLSDILTEIKQLTQNGVREIHLLGQNVNAYRGLINANASSDELVDFAFLLECIHALDKVIRIRFTTSHPNEMTQRIIDCYAKLPKLVSHLHLPVQSGSDKILAAMKRGYTALEYKSIIRRIRAYRPTISFSSDFIIGFPGETEDDYLKTLKLIDDVHYDNSFSFIYSPRPGTPAASFIDETPHSVKLERLQKLQAKIEQSAEQISEQMLGTKQKVLVEGYSRSYQQNNSNNALELTGRTDNFKVVNFTATSIDVIGRIIEVEITSARKNSLQGIASEI